VEVPEPVITPIAPGEVVSGNIAIPGEIDIYTFDVVAGDRIFFDALTGSSFNFTWRLQPPSGALLFNTGFADRDTIQFSTAGVYSLIVDGSTDRLGPYTFQLWDVPVDTPQALALDTSVPGAIDIPGQTRSYTFSAAAGQSLSFDLIFGEANGAGFKLLDPNGGTVFNLRNTDLNVASLPLTGTYTMVADGVAADFVGQYSFQVSVGGAPPPLPAAANLVVSSLTAPSRVIADPASVEVSWTVTNQGPAATSSSSWIDRIFLSTDATYSR
jgi:hypothetical protein